MLHISPTQNFKARKDSKHPPNGIRIESPMFLSMKLSNRKSIVIKFLKNMNILSAL